ncbi:MAG: Endonuclease/exonuclease/phosphatase [candidate division NC10 bacterium]|nr:Endonuclease/exonuclease/phosphatase [candidate division NC10 bacterium]
MAGTDSPQFTRRFRRALRPFTIACAIGYPLALAAIAAAFRFVGERWWVTLAAMYLPRLGFALPLPLIVGLVYWVRVPRRYLVLQAVSLLLVVVPLMGFNPGIGRLMDQASGPSLRVMSFNVSFGRPGMASVIEQAQAFGADTVLLQDAKARFADELRNGFQGWNLRIDGEFVLATRHRLRNVFVPPDLTYPQGKGGAHYVHYTLETPLGLADVFNDNAAPRPRGSQGQRPARGDRLGPPARRQGQGRC